MDETSFLNTFDNCLTKPKVFQKCEPDAEIKIS